MILSQVTMYKYLPRELNVSFFVSAQQSQSVAGSDEHLRNKDFAHILMSLIMNVQKKTKIFHVGLWS